MARQMRLQRTGNVDIVYDMQPRHHDLDYGAFMDQVVPKALWQLG